MSASASALACEPTIASECDRAAALPRPGAVSPLKGVPAQTERVPRMSGGGDWTWRWAAPVLVAWLLFYAVAVAGSLREERTSKAAAHSAHEPVLASAQ